MEESTGGRMNQSSGSGILKILPLAYIKTVKLRIEQYLDDDGVMHITALYYPDGTKLNDDEMSAFIEALSQMGQDNDL